MTGGGTAGHITPLLSLAHALRRAAPACRIVYIGHEGDKFDRLQVQYHDFDDVAFINAGKFRRYHGESLWRHLIDVRTLLLNARDFFRAINSIGRAYKILGRLGPDVVFSKGGFVSLPVGIAARLQRIPIVTHDSDATAGIANRIVGRWALVHATGMPAQFYKYSPDKVEYVGIPIDEHISSVDGQKQAAFKKEIGLGSSDFVLLVAGGSTGSQDINQKVLAIAPQLLAQVPRLYIVHITGQAAEDEIKKDYQSLVRGESIKHIKVIGFTDEFYKYSGAADLIISRAGATTLAEFADQGKACILIPSLFLTAGHQVKNAAELQKLGAVRVVANDASAQVLQAATTELINNDDLRQQLAQSLNKTAKLNAAETLAQLLLDVAAKSPK